ncbi:hypothetical protein HZI73_10890 [Vallitalea pronyensis]|uniref:BD-FAE-like domain-containing protein n=1 Tax=Vallitalea pronyensis TaxID=1348613 RepID=A0A8J8MJE8_9FIRM|nr:alpha/beta hydrolase [Vallitalea pronyensis]QUI22764.1 hypothetical protein HZI73_10890 [Vallitalea pronyensis]
MTFYEKTIPNLINDEAKIEIIKDIVYKSLDNDHLKMDLYKPSIKVNKGRPVVVFIHGGPSKEKNIKEWGIFASWSKLLASVGYTAIVLEYRYVTQKAILSAEEDILDGLDFIRNSGETLSSKSDQINLFFFSGAGIFTSTFIREKFPFIRSIVCYYTLMEKKLSKKISFEGGMSPYHVLNKTKILPFPMFFAKAGKDRKAINSSIDRFISLKEQIKFTHSGDDIVVEYHEEGNHGFDVLNHDDRTKAIIMETLKFLNRYN